MRIGDVHVKGPAVLAPMAGVCNLAFRLLCKEEGAAMVCSEFISAKALIQGNERTRKMLALDERERPVSIQIFGNDPAEAAEAARIVESVGADIVDFNMGCPVPKVIKAEAGAALMRVPDKAQAILEAMVEAVSIPVTVKMRTGWDDDRIDVIDLAARFENVGVQAVAVHGRSKQQGRSGTANWDVIGEVKARVRIPVIGNGDVKTPEDAARMIDHTQCDAVMIGRGALGNPWIFRRINAYLEGGTIMPEPSLAERVMMARRHLHLLAEIKSEHIATREMRQHAPAYFKGFPGAAELRRTFVQCETIADYEAVFNETLSSLTTGSAVSSSPASSYH